MLEYISMRLKRKTKNVFESDYAKFPTERSCDYLFRGPIVDFPY